MTMEALLPEMVFLDFVTVLATITAIYDGALAGGLALLPGLLVQVAPQEGDVVLRVVANPLKAAGTEPPERLLSFCHCAPHHVRRVVGKAEATVRSPNTKEPLDRKVKITAGLVSLADEERVSPAKLAVTVVLPNAAETEGITHMAVPLTLVVAVQL